MRFSFLIYINSLHKYTTIQSKIEEKRGGEGEKER